VVFVLFFLRDLMVSWLGLYDKACYFLDRTLLESRGGYARLVPEFANIEFGKHFDARFVLSDTSRSDVGFLDAQN
jgi:hypothetical protein